MLKNSKTLLSALLSMLYISLPSVKSFGSEYVLGDYPKGDIPYIVFSQKHTGIPFWGIVLEYELSFSDHFPFDQSQLKFEWNGKPQTRSDIGITKATNVLRWGYLVDKESQKTIFKAGFGQQMTSETFLWQLPNANIVARYVFRLTPPQNVVLAAWGLDTPPEGSSIFFNSEGIWQAGTVLPLKQYPNSLSLTLTIDGFPLDPKGYRPVEEAMLRDLFPELLLFDHVKFPLEQYSELNEHYQKMVSFYAKYELTQCKYARGMASLIEVLDIKVMMLQELISMLQLYKTQATDLKKSQRDKEIIENISQLVQLYKVQYETGTMSLQELNSIENNYDRIKKKIETSK